MDAESGSPTSGSDPAASDAPVPQGPIPYPRAAGRVTIEFFLRQVENVSAAVGGDYFLGLILTAMGAANVRRLPQRPELSMRHSAIHQALPDAMKAPISVSALAASLGLPYETVRRHVGKLHQRGMCVKVAGGWIVPSDLVATDLGKAVVERNIANLRQFILALRAAGVDIDAIR